MVPVFGAVIIWTVISVFTKSLEVIGFCLQYKLGMIKISRRLRYVLSLFHLVGGRLAVSALERWSSATSGMAVATMCSPFGCHLCIQGSFRPRAAQALHGIA